MRTKCVVVTAVLLFSAVFTLAENAKPRIVHVFVALADNKYQGIVPVPARIGNGDDPDNNLYWGAAAGVRTFFARSTDWKLVWRGKSAKALVLERCVFKHRDGDVYLVADAYRGREIKQAIIDFLEAAGGNGAEKIRLTNPELNISAGGAADLVAYVGHDGLMDFELSHFPPNKNTGRRDAILLACASKQYFSAPIRASGAYPLLWTTNLMAPEAYTLKAALDGWILGEGEREIQQRAAEAYSKYQKCSVGAAKKLLVPGW
ncbi:conserved hypothetical protein [Candidatus Koribacter versatilis Ellin345]|uniref:Uncharacterized protein n=1 Tax=Koribacter versatilis (strain Ellin345) TaxID=204669 RepID=Q1II82_KORVE|nr:hypothetical protein [Candidatus Koribacter versatilis]ABF43418.1 conserved hypothetical protein [Candidatus Koribacter versatilis Ellin345]